MRPGRNSRRAGKESYMMKRGQSAAALTHALTQHAKRMGIDLVGCTSAGPFTRGHDWQELDPRKIMPDARSVVVTACYLYGLELREPTKQGAPRLRPDSSGLRRAKARGGFGPSTRAAQAGEPYGAKVVADFLKDRGYEAAPAGNLPQKQAPVRSGIAYYGKNSIVHADGFGSYLALSTAVTDAELECVDGPIESSDCGDCDACVEACPTGALQPYQLTVARCICPPTGGLWGRPISREDRAKVDSHIFRCGFCQEACPKNEGLTPRTEFPFEIEAREDFPELIPLILGDEAYYQATLPAFALRAGVDTMRRNVILAAGNSGDSAVVPHLIRALDLPHIETRAAAAWSLGRLSGPAARKALRERLAQEQEPTVREEIEQALSESG